jgi:serine/threonine protein kinase/regulator of sirC expression with transglutaminase-like and TPR domain
MAADQPGSEEELEALLRAYERAWLAARRPNLVDFLPPPEHPRYAEALLELVRLDLEFGHDRGEPIGLEEYRLRFPLLFDDPRLLREVVFEEYRLRLQAGEAPSLGDYERAYGVDVADRPRPALPGLPAPPLERHPLAQRGSSSSSLETVARAYQRFRRQPDQDRDVSAALDAFPADFEVAELFGEMHRSDPKAADRLAQAVVSLPEAGSDFLGFRLLAELGRGAFGRVFLARQGDLANRLVALKVSTDLFSESQALAQLQHTNIIPIYSVHRVGALQALCMPWFGGATLAALTRALRGGAVPASGDHLVRALQEKPPAPDPPLSACERVPRSGNGERGPSRVEGEGGLLRETLGRLTWVQAVLQVGARLARGLQHAHQRGILHRDLKPANVLLAEDGQPILLDFNLAHDAKLRSTAAGARVGGTLPYMSPEQIEAFAAGPNPGGSRPRPLDGRSDLYSLGAVLFELLTGRLPFQPRTGPTREVLSDLLEQRRAGPPPLRAWNPAVSPAAAAIVRKCLEPDPDRRYSSAAELAEDIERHLADLPLLGAPEPLRERAWKWLRRHPRLTSAGAVATAAAVVILALASSLLALRQGRQGAQARDNLERFEEERRDADFLLNARSPDASSLEAGARRARQALSRYRVLKDERWASSPLVLRLTPTQRERLREEVADLLWTLARATAFQASRSPEPGKGELFASALELNRRAEACFPRGGEPKALRVQRAYLCARLGDEGEAGRLLREADKLPARTARDHFLLGLDLLDRGRTRQSAELFRQAARRLEESLLDNPRDPWGWYLRGNCHDLLQQNRDAATCYTVCLSLRPGWYEAWFNRALVHCRERRWRDACSDLGRAIDLRPDAPRAYLQRALAEKAGGDLRAAERDLSRALALGLPATRLYSLRAEVRGALGDQEGANRDVKEGLLREPTDEHGWLERGVARLGRKDSCGALADFERALKVNPRYLPAWQNKAHVLAGLGRREQALLASEQAVALYPDFVPARLGRGVLLARLGKRREALRDARAALDADPSPATLYQAANIFALTSRQNPGDRLEAFPLLKRALAGGFGLDVIDRDRDMDPIRESTAFRRIVKAARDLRAGP